MIGVVGNKGGGSEDVRWPCVATGLWLQGTPLEQTSQVVGRVGPGKRPWMRAGAGAKTTPNTGGEVQRSVKFRGLPTPPI